MCLKRRAIRGNNLLPRIPEIQAVFDDKWVIGGLISVLGEDYYMQPHRHPHFNRPKSEGAADAPRRR